MHRFLHPGLPLLLASPLLLSVPVQDEDAKITQEELDEIVADIQAEIEELRGLPFKHAVPASTMDHAGFLEFARQEMEEDMTPEEIAAEEAVAKLLGLIPPGMDLVETMFALLEEQVGGFYDPERDEFFLLSTFTGGLARIILAHELTHALDDQYQDLDAGMEEREGNDDAAFAYKAVVEGSATALMNQWTMEHMGELDPGELAASGDMGMEVMGSTPPYIWKPLLGEYLKGAAFLNRTESVIKGTMGVPPLADVQAAFENPPLSSEQVLHPDKYWDPELRDDPVAVHLGCDELPAGWSRIEENTLGELRLAMVVEPLKKRKGLRGQLAMIGMRYTTRATEGWGGDRYVLLGKDDARVLLSVSVWDREKDAGEFAAACAKLEDHITEGAAACAELRKLEGCGHFVQREPDSDLVVLCSWVGASRADVEALIASVKREVERPER